MDVVGPGGRIAVITFHSLETRIVRKAFSDAAGRSQEPSGPFVPATLNKPPKSKTRVRVITKKPLSPTVAEIRFNGRCRSAKL